MLRTEPHEEKWWLWNRGAAGRQEQVGDSLREQRADQVLAGVVRVDPVAGEEEHYHQVGAVPPHVAVEALHGLPGGGVALARVDHLGGNAALRERPG